jgi:hypothetical protein
MARKVSYEQALVTDRWISFDPLDNEIIERLFKKNIREGEEKLALAVLESAVEDFQKHVLSKDGKERKLFQEAEKWFFEKHTDQLFSFEYICATLGLAPSYIRRGLLSWKQSKLKTHSVSVLVKAARSQPKPVLSTRRSDFPRRRRFASATPSHTNSSKPVADRIPGRSLCRLRFDVHVEGESIWLAASGHHLVYRRHRRVLCCDRPSRRICSEGQVVGEDFP